jgi:hypothetical protein
MSSIVIHGRAWTAIEFKPAVGAITFFLVELVQIGWEFRHFSSGVQLAGAFVAAGIVFERTHVRILDITALVYGFYVSV